LRQGDELGISGWGFAGLAALELGMKDLASSTRDRVRRFIRPGTRSLDLSDTYERSGNFWGYDADRYAIALMLYHALSPADDMTTRLANSLIERQRRGIWNNTSSSFWAVLAFGTTKTNDCTGPLNAFTDVGGVAVGESPEDIRRVVALTAPLLPADKPRYLMGVGRPEDIAEAVLWLASPRAGYVNGAEIMVDGGVGQVLMQQLPRPGYEAKPSN
jgi:hypothetical protein